MWRKKGKNIGSLIHNSLWKPVRLPMMKLRDQIDPSIYSRLVSEISISERIVGIVMDRDINNKLNSERGTYG